VRKSKILKALSAWSEKHGVAESGRKSEFRSASGLPVEDLYVPQPSSSSEEDFLTKVGFPGEYPYTRGVYPSMYRGRKWTMRQYAGFGTAEETNKRYQYLLARGTNGLSVAFDLPTQMGRDSDHPLAKGEVGRVGVAIDSLEDMERLFDQIPLADVSTSMTINSTAHVLLAYYIAVAKKQGVALSELRGTIQNDVLKEYIARGTYIYPPDGALKIVSDIFEYCKSEVPLWNTISVSGYHIREAGSTAVQELAFTLADGIAYVEAALARGLDVDDFAPRIAFFFNCHNDFLEEIAKFRVARRMWAKIMKERFSAKKDKSCMLRFHTQTAGSSLTAQQPMLNIVRTSVQAVAAVLGGTQSLHTNAYDEALCLPTEESARIALRTQQVIAEESGLADVVDPFGGSYVVEEYCDNLEREATALIEKVDSLGGMVAAIEASFPQGEIEESAYQYQRALENEEKRVVGVNAYEEKGAGSKSIEIHKVDPRLEVSQKESLERLKAKRDEQTVELALKALKTAATEDSNLMPHVVTAAEAYASIGEISDVLREVFGEYGQGS